MSADFDFDAMYARLRSEVTPTPSEADREYRPTDDRLHWNLTAVLHEFRRSHDGTWDNVHAYAALVERLVREG